MYREVCEGYEECELCRGSEECEECEESEECEQCEQGDECEQCDECEEFEECEDSDGREVRDGMRCRGGLGGAMPLSCLGWPLRPSFTPSAPFPLTPRFQTRPLFPLGPSPSTHPLRDSTIQTPFSLQALSIPSGPFATSGPFPTAGTPQRVPCHSEVAAMRLQRWAEE